MSPEFYRVLHVISLIVVYFSLGALAWNASIKGEKKKVMMIVHGVALLIMLVAGFGMLAKLKIAWGLWATLKLVCWLILGVSPVLFRRMGLSFMTSMVLMAIVGAFAIVIANYRIIWFGI